MYRSYTRCAGIVQKVQVQYKIYRYYTRYYGTGYKVRAIYTICSDTGQDVNYYIGCSYEDNMIGTGQGTQVQDKKHRERT
jgi:hypothetical protein